jgi:hypothetical protein
VGLAVGLIFILFNTAGRGFGTTSRAVLTVMPALALQNIPLATTLLTNGIALLILYMAWMPRTWLARTRDI